MSESTRPRAYTLAALVVISASFLGVHCNPVVIGGGDPGTGGSSGTSTSGGTTGPTASSSTSSSATGGPSSSSSSGTVAVGCAALLAQNASVPIFSLANALGSWSNASWTVAGKMYVDPPAAGAWLLSGPAGTEMKYTQLSDSSSFGVWFNPCLNASVFSGITFKVWPLSAPAGSRAILRVQTTSTTVAPQGTCVPQSAATAGTDCVAPSFTFDYGQFGSKTPYAVTWGQLAGANPPQTGAVAATEIVGLRWVIDAFVGPPAMTADIDVMVNDLAFKP